MHLSSVPTPRVFGQAVAVARMLWGGGGTLSSPAATGAAPRANAAGPPRGVGAAARGGAVPPRGQRAAPLPGRRWHRPGLALGCYSNTHTLAGLAGRHWLDPPWIMEGGPKPTWGTGQMLFQRSNISFWHRKCFFFVFFKKKRETPEILKWHLWLILGTKKFGPRFAAGQKSVTPTAPLFQVWGRPNIQPCPHPPADTFFQPASPCASFSEQFYSGRFVFGFYINPRTISKIFWGQITS